MSRGVRDRDDGRPSLTDGRAQPGTLIGSKSAHAVVLRGIPFDTYEDEVRQFLEGRLPAARVIARSTKHKDGLRWYETVLSHLCVS